MEKKSSIFIKNVLRAMTTNITSILINFILVFLLPKYLGNTNYGYWQVYLLYLTYLCYSSIGWCEGIHLKYGGYEYEELPKERIASQFWVLLAYQVILSIVGIFFVSLVIQDADKKIILILAFISAALNIVRYLLQMILQAVNKFKEFARIATGERVLFFVLVILFLISKKQYYVYYIVAEIITRIILLIYAVYVCKDIIFVKMEKPKQIFIEAKDIISMGYKLLIAGAAGQLIIGIIRFAIEQEWGIDIFGKVSLSLSMSTMLITCISAISVVLFPTLKKMEISKLSEFYMPIRELMTTPLLIIIVCYAPMRQILSMWLPSYSNSLKYLAILLPICVYETRTQVVIFTYLKALRQETKILWINIISVLLSAAATAVTIYYFKNLDLAMVSIIVLLGVKSYLSEYILTSFVEGIKYSDWIAESLLVTIFIVSNWILGDLKAFIIYVLALIIYILLKQNDLKQTSKKLKALMGR